MHWFVVDETNKNPKSGQFLVIGGLVFRPKQVKKIHDAIERIRTKYGYRDGDSLKFQVAARPAHVTIEDATNAKRAVIKTLAKYKVRMVVYVILHDIATNKSERERMEMGLNTLAWAYHRLLGVEKATGAMIIDRDDGQHGHLAHLFQNGIKVGSSTPQVRDRVAFFGMTANNASHLSSAVDIALGGFRYCVNAASLEDEHSAHMTAKSIFKPLSRLVWGVKQGDVRRLGGYGFHARPLDVRVPHFASKYEQLRGRLNQYSRAEAAESVGTSSSS